MWEEEKEELKSNFKQLQEEFQAYRKMTDAKMKQQDQELQIYRSKPNNINTTNEVTLDPEIEAIRNRADTFIMGLQKTLEGKQTFSRYI